MKVLKYKPVENFVAQSREEAIQQWINVIVEKRAFYTRIGSIGRNCVKFAIKRLRQVIEAGDNWRTVYVMN